MKNGTGLKKETAAALATLLGPTIIIPALFLIVEKDEFVRFWAMQSILVYVTLFILNWAFILSVFLIFLTPIVFILGVLLWLVMTYKAWQGDKMVLPIVGNIAESLLKKVK